MAGVFKLKKFSEINLADPFFDSLKTDYPGNANSNGFETWYREKAEEGRWALVFEDDQGVGAFLSPKAESEELRLMEDTLPKKQRLKISTLKVAERCHRQRLGEGALGIVLWRWQARKYDEIYVTIFAKQKVQIEQLTKFGFKLMGHNLNGECVYLKSRHDIDYSDAYKAFPFINPDFQNAGYLIIDDKYHDRLFPYSELMRVKMEQVFSAVSNGISKIYIGAPIDPFPYKAMEPVFIYRRFTGDGPKKYKSCLTTYCVVKNVTAIKKGSRDGITLEEYLSLVGNKSVFTEQELRDLYNRSPKLAMVELVYYGYFGSGNNVNMDWLEKNGYWGKGYPTTMRLSPEQFRGILQGGRIDVENVIID